MRQFHSICCLFAALNVSLAASEPAIIPRPLKLAETGSTLSLKNATITTDPMFPTEASMLGQELRVASGGGINATLERLGGTIILTATGARDPGPEGYTLETGPTAVTIRARTPAGIFYGGQTLLQLLPVSGTSDPVSNWTVPGVTIEDRPYMAWRGFMLDESRHFFGKQTVAIIAGKPARPPWETCEESRISDEAPRRNSP